MDANISVHKTIRDLEQQEAKAKTHIKSMKELLKAFVLRKWNEFAGFEVHALKF